MPVDKLFFTPVVYDKDETDKAMVYENTMMERLEAEQSVPSTVKDLTETDLKVPTRTRSLQR